MLAAFVLAPALFEVAFFAVFLAVVFLAVVFLADLALAVNFIPTLVFFFAIARGKLIAKNKLQ